MPNILTALRDPKLFRPWFRDPETWSAWRAFLAALFGLSMAEAELAIYRQCTGRTTPPTAVATEGWLVCGRRAGKSFVLALVAVYLACFHRYRQHLAPGERATVMIIARDRRQTRIILGYIRASLTEVPMLARMIERETADAFDLEGGVTIEVQTASYRSVRGYAIVAALCDELAFWPTDDSAEPDFEVINALRPGMAQFPNAMLLCASSPYAKRGALHDAFQRHYGKDSDPVLVWRAPTRTMNPTVSRSVIDAAMARDASDAAAEWMAEFRSDLESFISRGSVLACVDSGTHERPPTAGIMYESFTDPSGGSSDSMTCAIGHREGSRVIVDALREVAAPFDPDSAVDEFVRLFTSYGIRVTNGDRYAAQWVATAFEKRGVAYRHAELPRSQLYLNLLPHLNSKTIRLLDVPRGINQICALERRTARGARDTIDHPRDQHDDLANAVAGLAFVVAQRPEVPRAYIGSWDDIFINAPGRREQREREAAERNVRNGSAPCTLSAAELASTMPSDEFVRAWRRETAAAAAQAQKVREPKLGRGGWEWR